MPKGSGRPSTRDEKDAVRTMKKARGASSEGEMPAGTKWASSVLAERTAKGMAKAKPQKRPAMEAAKFRVKRAINKGKSVKY